MSKENLDTKLKKDKLFDFLGTDKFKGVRITSKKFDCDWRIKIGLEDGLENACEKCHVCKYTNFLEWAASVAPSGSQIERIELIDKYFKFKPTTN